MTRNFILLMAFIGLASCHNNTSADSSAARKDSSMDHAAMNMADSSLKDHTALKSLAFDYKKDPACGMPLTAGLEDTTTYKGKLYGFCSKECKNEFLKTPHSYVAKIK